MSSSRIQTLKRLLKGILRDPAYDKDLEPSHICDMYSSLKLCPQESKAMSKLFTLLRLLVPKITGSAYDYHPSLWIPFAVLANAFLRAVDADQFCRDFCPSISLASAQALLLSPGGSVSGLWFPDLLFSREIPRTNKSEDPIRSLSEARGSLATACLQLFDMQRIEILQRTG